MFVNPHLANAKVTRIHKLQALTVVRKSVPTYVERLRRWGTPNMDPIVGIAKHKDPNKVKSLGNPHIRLLVVMVSLMQSLPRSRTKSPKR